MRVTGRYLSNTLLLDHDRQMERLSRLQTQIATGRAFSAPEENPVAAGAVMRLQNDLARGEQFTRNLHDGKTQLQLSDAALGDVQGAAIRAKGLILSQVDDGADPGTREATAAEVEQMIQELVSIGNRKVEGRYLFAGHPTKTAPFTRDGNGVRYAGDRGQIKLEISEGVTEQVNVNGVDAFGALSSQVAGYVDLNPAMTSATLLSDLRAGSGVQAGKIRITDGLGGDSTVDLTTARTVGDVITRVGAASVGVTASVFNSGGATSIRLTKAGANLTVTEVNGGSTASHLGILQSAAGATLTGTDRDPRLTEETAVTALDNGTGVALAGGLTVTNGSLSGTISLAGATTVRDLLFSIESAGLGLEGRLSDDGKKLNIVSRVSGASLRIAENAGTTAAELGVLSLHGATTLSSLNQGDGVAPVAGTDFTITTRNGTVVSVDLSSAQTTLTDVVTAINAAAAAAGVGATLVASVNNTGANGLRILDTTAALGTTTVADFEGSPVAKQLGILKSSVTGTIQGDDVNPVRPVNIFQVLEDFHDALLAGDTDTMDKAGLQLDTVLSDLLASRANVGARVQRLEFTEGRTEDQAIRTSQTLSERWDVDLTRAITELNMQQVAFQGLLQSMGVTMQTSLLNYL